MNDLVVSPATSMLSMRCSSSEVPRVTETSACVCPRVKTRGAVRARQHAGLDGDRPDGVEIASIDPLALFQHLLPHHAILDFLELVADLPRPFGELDQERCGDLVLDALDRRGTRPALSAALIACDIGPSAASATLAWSTGSTSALVHGILAGAPALSRSCFWRPMSSRMPFCATLSASSTSASEISSDAALDHHDGVGRAAHDEVDRRELELLEGGIENPVVLDAAHAHRRERAIPRHDGKAERRRRRDARRGCRRRSPGRRRAR